MWPDGSVVIRHWIVTRLARSDRPNSPAGEGCFICECRRHATGVLLGSDTSKKTVACVRRSHLAGLLSAIERKRVCGKLVTPEGLFEASGEGFRLLRQIARPCIIAEELSQ